MRPTNEIECLYCTTKVNGETPNLAVVEMRRHLRKDHPEKCQL